ncbi:protein DpdG [Mycolicibacterium sp. CR10]|uniref:protein DpdG n=1 Tax=Mycolicibacterium sp. CR10 TaxID=2562314 RepID=UPI0010C0566D|nr:protein DpdG [Mycolicibacterium sp. CR10]
MALLNPPELRPSGVVTILRYLSAQRAQQDVVERLLATVAPPSLKGDPQSDVSHNLRAATELGLIFRDGEKVVLAENACVAVQRGQGAVVKLLRARVFDDSLNTAPWRSQVGARDLTNALSWYLTLAPSDAPIQMERGPRSAEDLQLKDFGPRQEEDGGRSSNWPINNNTRWNAFRRWSCSLGFAWANPNGHLVPDPTAAIRDSLPEVFVGEPELTARDFMKNLGELVPVLDGGRYREFVTSNWERPSAADVRGLTVPLSDALERLAGERAIAVYDRADSPRVAKADGSTFSHVGLGARP